MIDGGHARLDSPQTRTAASADRAIQLTQPVTFENRHEKQPAGLEAVPSEILWSHRSYLAVLAQENSDWELPRAAGEGEALPAQEDQVRAKSVGSHKCPRVHRYKHVGVPEEHGSSRGSKDRHDS